MIPIDEMRRRALLHPTHFAAWSTAIEICERLDLIIERLDRLLDVQPSPPTPLHQRPRKGKG